MRGWNNQNIAMNTLFRVAYALKILRLFAGWRNWRRFPPHFPKSRAADWRIILLGGSGASRLRSTTEGPQTQLHSISARRGVIVQTGTKPMCSTHSSASVAAQINNRSSMTAPMSRFPRYDNYARTRSLLEEPGEMSRHGSAIMGNQNPCGLRRDSEHVRIANADNTTLMSTQDIERGLRSAKAKHDLLVEGGVRQESRPHALGAGVLLRASASFA